MYELEIRFTCILFVQNFRILEILERVAKDLYQFQRKEHYLLITVTLFSIF